MFFNCCATKASFHGMSFKKINIKCLCVTNNFGQQCIICLFRQLHRHTSTSEWGVSLNIKAHLNAQTPWEIYALCQIIELKVMVLMNINCEDTYFFLSGTSFVLRGSCIASGLLLVFISHHFNL